MAMGKARTVLDPEVADVWLDGHFELVSIGVVGGARGPGISDGTVIMGRTNT